jgi:hypothetical protein
MRSLLPFAAALSLAACLVASPLHAQTEGFGKIDPTPPAGISVDNLIKKMGAREAEFEAARNEYEFRQTVKINTISDDTNKPDGEYQQVTDITFDKDGKRVEHVVFAPQNTLERVILTESDMRDIAERLPFIMTTAQLPEYVLTYAGRQHVDALETYVFDVKPKELVKGHRYFQGRIWVDQADNEIVLVNGLNVPQETRPGKEDLSPPFTTYYEQIDGKYWFPTYTKAEGILHFAPSGGNLSQEIHLRATVKYTDYKKFVFKTKSTIKYNGGTLESAPPPPTEPEGKVDDIPKDAPAKDPDAPVLKPKGK